MDLRVRETHVSWVFLVGDRVFKVKKPVQTGFLDWRATASRERACIAEVALNRRLAPDVYLGVGHFQNPDGTTEPVVVMKRMPADRSLSSLIGAAGSNWPEGVSAVARRLARFHEGAGRNARISRAGEAASVQKLWRQNLAQLRDARSSAAGEDVRIAQIDELGERYIAHRDDLFRARVNRDRIVDGHGDLLCDDIFITDDGPQVLDCLEFDEELRFGDVVADLSSLVMDLMHHGRQDLADELIGEYQSDSRDTWPGSLTAFWVAYRALVRAKVDLIRRNQLEPGDPDERPGEAEALIGLAWRQLRAGAVRIVLVGGIPGSGKSTLAAALHEATGWPVVSSDHVRHETRDGGGGIRASLDQGAYSPHELAANYRRLLAAGLTHVLMGESVILDATWARREWRTWAEQTAATGGATLVQIRCAVSTEIAGERVEQRGATGLTESEATRQVSSAIGSRWEPWPEATDIDTAMPMAAVLEAAEKVLGGPAPPS